MSLHQRPNVLLICVDDMRADHLGCAGNAIVATPNLDALAARGTHFSRAYCNTPICMPSRATMFTGLLPRDHGVRVNGQTIHPEISTLPQLLHDAGYRTHAAGKMHLSPWVSKVRPLDARKFPEDLDVWKESPRREFDAPYFGFDSVDFVGGHTAWAYGPYLRWLKDRGGDEKMLAPESPLSGVTTGSECYKMSIPPELHYNRYIADSTIRFIERATTKSAHEDRPFFAYCSFPDPHPPFAAPRPYCDLYDAQAMPLPHRRAGEIDRLPPFYQRVISGEISPSGCSPAGVSDDQWRLMLATTYGMITHIDDEIGRVLAALRRANIADNTVVIFTSDHGDMMGDHGLISTACYTFRSVIEVPLIAVLGDSPKNHVPSCDALISHLDLMPTILDTCRVPLPGANWRRTDSPFDRESIQPISTCPGASWAPVLRGDAPTHRQPVVIENDETTTGLRARCLVTQTHRLTIYPGTPDGELFDLVADPWELNNLWYDPAHRAIRNELSAQLLDRYSTLTPWHPVPPWNS